MPSFDSCAFSTKSVGKLPMKDIRATARSYEQDGLAPDAALIRSLQDRLDAALLAEKRITAAVRSAYQNQDGARFSVSGDKPWMRAAQLEWERGTEDSMSASLPDGSTLYITKNDEEDGGGFALNHFNENGEEVREEQSYPDADAAKAAAQAEYERIFAAGPRYSTASPLAAAPLRMVNPLVRRLADAGAIVLHDDASTLPVKGKAPQGVQALTTKDGTIHVVANALGDNAKGIVLHEAFHAGAEALVGSQAWSKLMKRLANLHALSQKNSGAVGEFFSRARDRVAAAKGKGAVASGMEAEEFGAYAIEEYARAPASIRKWVDDLLGAVKAWALSRFGAQLGEVTPAQLSALAQLALLDVQATRMEPAFSVDRRAQDRAEAERRKRTIEVDGERRPIYDANGRLVAQDFPGQMRFWNWFKGSAVVNAHGEPLPMYRGVTTDTGNVIRTVKGGYFTSDPELASFYAQSQIHDSTNGERAANVMPVYLALKNPRVISNPSFWGLLRNGLDATKARPIESDMAMYLSPEKIAEYKEQGYDGIINEPYNEMIVFDAEQVKSVTGNNGQFDPDNADIRYSVAGAPQPAPTWTAPETTRVDDVVYILQDRFVDLKRVVQSIRKTSGDIGDKWDPYLQEELFHGRSATGFKNFLEDELRPLLTDMQARGVKMEDFEHYLVMRHAEETNEHIAAINPEMPDGGSGTMTADARAYLANLPATKATAYQALAARVDAMVKGTQQVLLDYGLEKQEVIDAWNGAYKHYVPLARLDMDNMLQGMGTGQGFSIRGSAAKRRVGSDKEVVNVLANLAQARERAIVRGEKNRLDLAVYGLALKAPNPDFWKPINPKKNPAGLQKELLAMGLPGVLVGNYMDEPKQKVVVPRAGGTPAGQQVIPGAAAAGHEEVVRRVNTMLRSAPNVLAVRVAGEDRFIFFNDKDERALRMATSLKNLNGGDLNWFLGHAAVITRWFAAVNTQYNPIFGAVNLIRDAQGVTLNLTSTPLNGKQGQVLAELSKMLWKSGGKWFRLDSLTGADLALWQDFQRDGGVTGYRAMFANGDERSEELQKELARMSDGTAKKAGRAVMNWISDYNTALENVTRIAVYKVAKENGMSPSQAASLAKNASTNFNRRGLIGSQVGSLYAFFNAAVQGTARIAQTLDPRTTHGKAIISGGLLLGAIQAVMLAAAGFDDDEPPEFIKQKNLVIPLGWVSGKKNYVTVPMPLGFNVLPTISRLATEFMIGGTKKPAKYITNLAGALADGFNPIGNAGFSLQTVLPTVVDPLSALESNRDYTGKKIYNEDMNPSSPTPGHTRARGGASVPAKWLAEGINRVMGGNDYVPGVWSPTPEHLEYLTGQITGGVGRELLKSFQTGQSFITGEELPTHRIPGASRFYGTTEDGATVRDHFRSNLLELNLLEQEYKGRREDKNGAKEFRAANPILTMADEAQAVQREVADLGKEKRRLMEKGDSAERVKLMDEKIRTRMARFNEKLAARKEKLEDGQ